MMHRWLAVLLLCLMTCLAYATSFNGLYISFHAGLANAQNNTTLTDANDTDSPIHFTAGRLGFAGSVQFGYSHVFQPKQVLMALEGTFNYQSIESNTIRDKTMFFDKIHSTDGFGLNAKLGRVFHHNTALYLIGGVNWQAFTLQLTDETPKKINNVSLRQLGYRVGVGSETVLTKKLMADIQVDYFNYGSFSHKQNNLTVTANPQFLLGSVGLIYIF